MSNKTQNGLLESGIYAVLFIDVRDSTRISATMARRDADNDARLIGALWTAFNMLPSVVGCPPTFCKSTGDGLMCIWKADSSTSSFVNTYINVLDISLCVNKPSFRKAVENDYPSGCPRIGIGLASGYLSHLEAPLDFFGFAANLASKLQDQARPNGGLVVDGEYGDSEHDPRVLRKIQRSSLEREKVLKASPLGQLGVNYCYISKREGMRWMSPDWSCIAWPGIAATQSRSEYGDQSDLATNGGGLNTKGITVITHEGIQGKIRTLKIWPRDVSREGAPIELIVDDIDALQAMHEDGTLSLAKSESVSRKSRQRISDKIHLSLSDYWAKCQLKFFFVPIRCGINALAWNPKEYQHFPRGIRKYSAIHERLETEEIHPARVGLYDNLGASLPILLLMCDPSLKPEDVYGADKERLENTLKRLKAITKGKKPFRLYPEAEALADALGQGDVMLVLGGGLWLAPFKRPYDTSTITKPEFCLPAKDGGFVWVEGAAISTHAPDPDGLVDFLVSNLLDDEYQIGLAKRIPYGSSPVTRQVTNAILKGPGRGELVDSETNRIFPDRTNLGKGLIVRKCPNKPELWQRYWSEIKKQCCLEVQN